MIHATRKLSKLNQSINISLYRYEYIDMYRFMLFLSMYKI